jgi:hypothetical protein
VDANSILDFQSLDESLAALEKNKSDCIASMLNMVSGKNNDLYPLDMLAVAALNRACSQLDAAIDLIRKQNYLVTASLIRLQLDSCIRLYGAWLVENPHEYAAHALKGIKLGKLKSRSGDFLTDAYLRNSLSKEFPWISKVYENASGFIHLSEKHIFSAITNFDDVSNKLTMLVGPNQKHIPDTKYLELASALSHITLVLLWLVKGWIKTKDIGKKEND